MGDDFFKYTEHFFRIINARKKKVKLKGLIFETIKYLLKEDNNEKKLLIRDFRDIVDYTIC